MFSNYNEIKLEIGNKNIWEITNICNFKNIPLNNQWVKEEIKRDIKNYLRGIKMKTEHTKNYEIELNHLAEIIFIYKCLY